MCFPKAYQSSGDCADRSVDDCILRFFVCSTNRFRRLSRRGKWFIGKADGDSFIKLVAFSSFAQRSGFLTFCPKIALVTGVAHWNQGSGSRWQQRGLVPCFREVGPRGWFVSSSLVEMLFCFEQPVREE